MKYIIICMLSGITVSCNENRSANTASTINGTSTVTSEPGSAAEGRECYMRISERDTAILVLVKNGTELSGKMLFDNYQMDGSQGTVKGKEDGEILKLIYDFQSEGMRSVMEVYFKKVPGGLLRGTGNMELKGDTAYYVSGINYSDKLVFTNIDCGLVKEKMDDL